MYYGAGCCLNRKRKAENARNVETVLGRTEVWGSLGVAASLKISSQYRFHDR